MDASRAANSPSVKAVRNVLQSDNSPSIDVLHMCCRFEWADLKRSKDLLEILFSARNLLPVNEKPHREAV